MRSKGISIALAACTLVVLTACGKHHGGDLDGGHYDAIELDPAQATVTVGLGQTATQSYTVYGIVGGTRTEITSACTLALDSSYGTAAAQTVTVGQRGGKTPITANCPGGTGAGSLIIQVTGAIVVDPAPAGAAGLFASATAGTDAARVPAIEYPLDKAVSPRNIPSVDMQWTAGGNDLFHVHLASTYLNLDVYTTDTSALLADADWARVAETSAGDRLAITVEGLLQSAPSMKFGTGAAAITISTDSIDKSAIYYWASSRGNIMSQVFGDPTQPSLVKGGCTSCHSVSRAGSRIGYSRCVGNDCGQLYAGFLKFDAMTGTWGEAVDANNKAIQGSYTTFAPIGNPFPDDTQAAALVALSSNALALVDPDTGATLPSNIDVAQHGPGAPRTATMPDWAWDGTRVVFASTPHAGQWIDVSDSRIAMMTYQYTGGTHQFGEPTFLVPDPITLPSGTYNNFFFPSFSPDGKVVVFDAARSAWRNFSDAHIPGQRLMLAGADGSFVVDLAAMNGPADADITWAHWAPDSAADYFWVVFSSERDYGHRVTAANTDASCVANGVKQCKQIWIGAIAKNRITGATTIDPSAPPMWLPGQDTKTENISPYWTVPAGLQ